MRLENFRKKAELQKTQRGPLDAFPRIDNSTQVKQNQQKLNVFKMTEKNSCFNSLLQEAKIKNTSLNL